MARYFIFEKTRSFNYKFKGFAEAKSGSEAIKNLKKRTRLNNTSPIIAIPKKVFMNYQFNPIVRTAKPFGKKIKMVDYKKPR